MKKLTCAIAALAMVMCSYVPMRAVPLGTLSKDKEWTLEFTSQTASPICVTIFYLGHNLDVIEAEMTLAGFAVEQRTFPKPGARVKRVIVEIDMLSGEHATLRFPNTQMGAASLDGDVRLVFNVV